MRAFLWLFNTVVDIYIWLLIATAVLSWLVAFNVVNARNPIVSQVGEFLYRITEPLLAPVRRLLPNLGGIDISMIVVAILLVFLQKLVNELAISIMFS